MIPAYIAKLSLKVCLTNVKAQKIDSSLLKTSGMVIAGFQIEDKFGRAWFFQKSFLLGNTSMEMVLEMPFLIFSNANIQFAKKKLT